MHITSQNELTHIKMSIWATAGREIFGLAMLYDTGAALNTGYLPCHNQIVKRHPSEIKRIEYFDGKNPSNQSSYVVQSRTNPSTIVKSTASLVPWWNITPYKCRNGQPVSLTISLLKIMPFNTILGIPTIMEAELEPRWSK